MNDIKAMTTVDIYQYLRNEGFEARRVDSLVGLFHRAGIFLANKIENHNWKWRSNYMREHAGCAFGAQFTNTVSPYINELVFRKYPNLRQYENPEADLPLLRGA